jgi:hypothetical protein
LRPVEGPDMRALLKIFLIVILITISAQSQEQKQGPIKIVSGNLYTNDTTRETVIRGTLVLENTQVGELKNVKVDTIFVNPQGEAVFRELVDVPPIKSKSKQNVDLFWGNPSGLYINRVEGAVLYESDGEKYQLPFGLETTAGSPPPLRYNDDR